MKIKKIISFLSLFIFVLIFTVNADSINYVEFKEISYNAEVLPSLLEQLNAITNSTDMEAFIINNYEALGISLTDYNTLSASKKNSVLNKLVGKTYIDLRLFVVTFTQTVQMAKESPSGGSSGGGGSGSSLLGEGWYSEGIDISDLVLSKDEENVHTLFFRVSSTFAAEANVYMCIYDNSGKVYKTIVQNKSIISDQPVSVLFNYTVDIPEGEYDIKCFIWDYNMNPLAAFRLNI